MGKKTKLLLSIFVVALLLSVSYFLMLIHNGRLFVILFAFLSVVVAVSVSLIIYYKEG
jgi:hypothetical protein